MEQTKGYISSDNKRKVTTHRLLEMKQRGEKISMLTAYDYSMASVIDQAGMDVILVGDSASNVMVGNTTTLPMTVDQMIYHGKSVMNAVSRAMVVIDMPFGSYQGNPVEAVSNAVKIMKETQADCLKLEGEGDTRVGTAYSERGYPHYGTPGTDASIDQQVRYLCRTCTG